VILDNLNTHKPAFLYEAFEPAEARRILRKINFHYTPKHGSWLNMAEIELSILQRPNGVKTGYQYDDVNRLAQLAHTNATGVAIEDFRYTYNADDEIDSIISLASPQLLPAAKTASAADAANRIAQSGQRAVH
jgi:hypothetical protein